MSAAQSPPPTVSEVLLIHELLLTTFGGMRGVTEQGFGKLDAALAAPESSMFGEDLYVGLPAKAAALFFRLARAHAFSDGNKRVALVGLLLYLERSGARLAASDEAVFEVTMALANDLTQPEVEAWIVQHLAAYGA